MNAIVRILGIVYCGSASSLLEPLLGGLVFQAISQLKILKHRIQNQENVEKRRSTTSRIYQNLARCVEHHKAILKYDLSVVLFIFY